MPQVFGFQSLMDRQFRADREFLLNWSNQHHIGLTDLIQSINDTDFNNEQHRQIILKVNDNAFDKFTDIESTNVQQIIKDNKETLNGVYLTRYEHTLNTNGIINKLWTMIKDTCTEFEIQCYSLITPSRQFRQINRDQKIEKWKEIINIPI